MRSVRKKETLFIVWHCSATPPERDIGAADLDAMHKARGWSGIGYHFVVRRDGRVEVGEDVKNRGAHVLGFNECSVGVCMVGGIDRHGKTECNFTPAQWESAFKVNDMLTTLYPKAKVLGHRDLSPDKDGDGEVEPWEWLKECPTFDAGEVFATRKPPVTMKNAPTRKHKAEKASDK